MPNRPAKISVLLELGDAERFNAYCKKKGFKKSSLIARLIRDHLDQEGFAVQVSLFDSEEHARANRGEGLRVGKARISKPRREQ
jgi:hypothetical protein